MKYRVLAVAAAFATAVTGLASVSAQPPGHDRGDAARTRTEVRQADYGRHEGWERGRHEGWERGRHEGWDRGRHAGWDRGHHYGWDHGRRAGWHHGRRVCRNVWRHHHRQRVCTWRRW